MKSRLAAVALAICALLAAAPTAGAQQPAGLTKVVPLTGKAENGRNMSGSYAIDRFRNSGNRLVAVGTVRGILRGRRVVDRDVRMPVQASRAPLAAQVPPIPGACQVLNLVLGPINLDLLGLVVRTNRINVRIDAVPGAGNLLGNLLCAITGLLDPQAAGARQTAPALNALLALVPRR